jgi:tRNA-specific 2-thiouridylase
MKNVTAKKIFVGLSGGVDSSVAAALLKEAGHIVVGVFIRTWQPDFIECSFREDRLDAMRVAAHLGIPFLECDAETEYKAAVADYMIAEYKAGRTPNPDVMCNREIKFGVFWRFAQAHGADYIATGHYARAEQAEEGVLLFVGADKNKDQSYFLWTLNQGDLPHVLFPVGGMEKPDVRKAAERFGLPTASKKDSQGICMLGDLDIKQFLAHYIEEKRGYVLDEHGAVIGYHDGVSFLTLGARHGFTITQKTPNETPYYILAKDTEKNAITVGHEMYPIHEENARQVIVTRTNWVTKAPEVGDPYVAQIRYRGDYLHCKIAEIEEGGARVIFDQPVVVAPGQSVVFYDGDICVGGGIVTV